ADPEGGEGLLRLAPPAVQGRPRDGRARVGLRVPRPQAAQAPVPQPVDRAHQRRRARARPLLPPAHGRPAQGRGRDRPQEPGGAGGGRPAGVRGAGPAGARADGLKEPGPSVTSEHASLAGLEEEARRALAEAASLPALADVRARLLGKKSALAAALRGIGQLPAAERGPAGAAANAIKSRIEALVEARRAELERGVRERALAETRLDVTLPGRRPPRGRLHPVTQVERDVVAFFHGLGFSVEEGPEVESQWNNFEALNMPADHPARDMLATFFVDGGHVLRTHTSPVQIRAMTGRQPPFRFIA